MQHVYFRMPLTLTFLGLLRMTGAQPHHNGGSTSQNNDAAIVVTLDLQRSESTVSAHYVGVTIDAFMLKGNWTKVGFSMQRVQNMARALSPCYFRFGGTPADRITYVVNDGHHVQDHHASGYLMTPIIWDTMNEFIQKVGWDFIMDLNALKRNADGSWNPDNARQLLQYSATKNYNIVGFELGNEYDLYYRIKINVTAAQLANDFVTLQQLLAEFPQFQSSFMIGPETAGIAPQYFRGFLAAGGAKVVRAASIHHYNGAKSVSDFVSVKVMDYLPRRLDPAMSEVRSVDPLLPLWVSETSTAAGGGVPGMSDRFMAGFLWLDKLGLSALKGVQAVIRQAFYHEHYGLINPQHNPNPDFWLTVLYKRIVRGAVFNATGRHDVRVYAACANTDNFKEGSVVVYMLNPNNYSVTFDLHQFHDQHRLRFSLTAGDHGGLLSKYMALNGVKLELVHDDLPPLKPASAPPGLETVPAYSYTFLVFPDAETFLCLLH